MGIRRALRLVEHAPPRRALPTAARTIMQGPSQLERLAWEDWYGGELAPTRDAAISVPAVHRARGLLCATIARMPLRRYAGAELVPDADQPAWLYRTDSPDPWDSPYQRIAWTVDDVLFHGVAVWGCERGADGFPLAVWRIDPTRYTWDTTTGELFVDAAAVDPASVIVIPGPDEGLLTAAGSTIATAARLERAAARHASNPVPSIELHQELDVALDDVEIEAMLTAWTAARNSDTGGVAFTSYGVKANVLGQIESQLLIEGRNAAAVDVARHTNIPAAMLDATNAGASLTYETTEGRNRQFLDYAVAGYADPIAARLSMDDVVPRGSRVGFDASELTAPAPAPGGAPTLD